MVKNPPANAGDTGHPDSIPGSGRSPGERNSKPPQYSCLGNPMDRGAWQATVHEAEKSQIRLGDCVYIHAKLSYTVLSFKSAREMF